LEKNIAIYPNSISIPFKLFLTNFLGSTNSQTNAVVERPFSTSA